MGTPVAGALCQMAWDSVLPFDTSSIPIEFVSENLRMVQSHVESGGIRGTRSRNKERVRISREQITGTITMRPSPTELAVILPYILGGTPVSTTYPLGESLTAFQVMIDRVTKVFTYTGCRVARATFSGSSGQPLELSLDIEGETEVVSVAGGFPALTFDTNNMFVLSDCVLALGVDASATEFGQFSLVIDNFLDAERYMNSITRSQLKAQDRLITLGLGMAYTVDEVDVYDQAVAGGTGSLTFTNGTQSLSFTFANLKSPAESPVVGGKSEVLLPLNLVAYKSGTDLELVTVLDSTP